MHFTTKVHLPQAWTRKTKQEAIEQQLTATLPSQKAQPQKVRIRTNVEGHVRRNDCVGHWPEHLKRKTKTWVASLARQSRQQASNTRCAISVVILYAVARPAVEKKNVGDSGCRRSLTSIGHDQPVFSRSQTSYHHQRHWDEEREDGEARWNQWPIPSVL